MALSVLKDIRKIYAGLNAEEIRGAAAREVNVGLMASNAEACARMEDFLVSSIADGMARNRALRSLHRADGSSRSFDFVLCEPGVPVPANGYVLEAGEKSLDSLLSEIVSRHANLETALARTFPLFRAAVTGAIVSRVAKENALFSIVTALPNVVPNLVELPWAVGEFASDTAFLTMNQIRMALMLAAAHGRPVGYTQQKVEIAGIVAGAFGWRAIARELVGKIPLGAGLIPKAAIAFAGTWVVGLGLDKLNRTGRGLSKQERRDAYADAFIRGKEAVRELAPHPHSAGSNGADLTGNK
jgi:hypothetical protein